VDLAFFFSTTGASDTALLSPALETSSLSSASSAGSVTVTVPDLDSSGRQRHGFNNAPLTKQVPVCKDGRFLCFDYQILHDRFGLRLETFTSLGDEDDDDEEKTPEYKQTDLFTKL